MEVNITELATTLAMICAVVAAFVGTCRWLLGRLRKLIEREVAAPARATSRQLATSNGHTVAQYVEDLAGDVKLLTAWASENRDIAKRAEEKADRALGAVDQTTGLLATLLSKQETP